MPNLTCPSCGTLQGDASGQLVFCRSCGGRLANPMQPAPYIPQPPALQAGGRPVAAIVWGVVGVVALAVAAGAALVLVSKPTGNTSSSGSPSAPGAVNGGAATTALADVETGPLTFVWHGRVHSETGEKPLGPGTPCTLTQVLVHGSKRDAVSTQLLTFQCEGHTLYDSSAAMAGMASTSGTLDELPVAGELHTYQYTTKYDDTGARTGDRNQITVSTRDGVVEAFRDNPPTFRVKATIDEFTAPRQGKPLFDDNMPGFNDVVRRVATATSRSGPVPFAGSRCELAISPAGSRADNCRVLLTCSGKPVFGGGTVGFEKCTMSAGEPVSVVDSLPTPKDKDPELSVNLSAGTATLGDTLPDGARYTVSFTLTH